MADEQRKDPRSIDERLDAITMNLELQVRETESLRETMHEGFNELRGSVAELRGSISELRETVAEFKAAIQPAVEVLLQTVLKHESRIERLERRAG